MQLQQQIKLQKQQKNKKYNTTSNSKSVLKYTADEFDLVEKFEKHSIDTTQNTTNSTALDDNANTVIGANVVTIPHSKSANYEKLHLKPHGKMRKAIVFFD